MADIGVIHLVRAANGIEPFRRFLESYTRHQGTLQHDLLIVFKGFSGKRALKAYRRLLKGLEYQQLLVSDVGYDLHSYYTAAKAFHNRFFYFLNSFSELLTSEWLAPMHHHLSRPGIGAVGASGNLNSWYTSLLLDWKRLALHRQYAGPVGGLRLRLRRALYRTMYPPFPNPHLRTNAFLIPRQLFLSLRYRPRFGKLDTYRFESGFTGLTRQLQARGLEVLVIGKNARGYRVEEWAESRTFWQAEQQNLLVADKQTLRFAAADEATRCALTRIAWSAESRG